jgi:hypothetical protein
MAKRYTVETYDAYDDPAERRHLVMGGFDEADEALKCAKEIVDCFLSDQLGHGKSPEEARKMFSCYGEVPMIFGEPKINFNPFDYADERINLLPFEKKIQNLAEDNPIPRLEHIIHKPDKPKFSTSKTTLPARKINWFEAILVWFIGIVLTVLLMIGFSSIGEKIGVPSNIDYGEAIMVTVGTGATSYDEERTGELTSYGLFSMVFSLMLGARTGISIYKRRLDGGYTKHDNIRFLACLFGVLAAAIVGAVLYLAFKGFSSWIAHKIHFILEVSAWVAIWFLIRKWNRDE